MNMIFGDSGKWFSNEQISIWRHDPGMCDRRDAYQIIAKNAELAEMQGVRPGHRHICAVVDDFGNLVKVPT